MATTEQPLLILDPSDKYRPEKDETYFRNYTSDNEYHNRVKNTYYQMHTNQTYEYATKKLAYWTRFDHAQMSFLDAVKALDGLVDESDPDVDVPNSVHCFQTAERIRKAHPDKEWFHLTGLIHDLGKVIALWGEPQWSTVGDTFAVGCGHSEKCVFGTESFTANPDSKHPLFSKELGIYQANCGLDNIIMSWGHDEYLYRVLRNLGDDCKLPDEALYMIRFHSFYPWHTGKDYMYLCNDKDKDMLKWVLEFNKFDLYSKADEHPNVDEILPYYKELIGKYLPTGKISW